MSELALTPRDIRFHAAGHLAAAVLLVKASNEEGARVVLWDVVKYINSPKVDGPPKLKELALDCADAPTLMVDGIKHLEKWFCDPFNTAIETNGA